MTIGYQKIIKVLEEQFGILDLKNETEDFSIADYLSDSIAFIEFIGCLEDEIGMELPDDFLLYDVLSSAHGLAAKLDDYIESQ